MISPFWQSFSHSDPVIAEMLRIDKGVTAPPKRYSVDGLRLDYTPQEYDRYHQIAGKLTYNRLLSLVGSEQYSRMTDDAKRGAAKKAISKAREDARSVLSDPDYPLPAKGQILNSPPSQNDPDPWTDFPDAGGDEADMWADFPDVVPQ